LHVDLHGQLEVEIDFFFFYERLKLENGLVEFQVNLPSRI
jgi:hypothetical protein